VSGSQHFFDLAEDAQRNFALAVPAGGLYRVETLGRLHTTGALGTSFIPDLDHQEANGIGQNMLIQHFLRAGQYRVVVGAKDSAGHLGIAARLATLETGATLVPGSSVRARMAADGGLVFPLEIAERDRYHLNLLNLGRNPTARLEDEEGWPIVAAGDLASFEKELRPGVEREDGSMQFECAVRVKRNPKNGPPNFLGPWVHGPAEARHLYLNWEGAEDQVRARFGRMKIHLASITWEQIEAVSQVSGRVLEATVSGVDRKGAPACASVPLLDDGWIVREG